MSLDLILKALDLSPRPTGSGLSPLQLYLLVTGSIIPKVASGGRVTGYHLSWLVGASYQTFGHLLQRTSASFLLSFELSINILEGLEKNREWRKKEKERERKR